MQKPRSDLAIVLVLALSAAPRPVGARAGSQRGRSSFPAGCPRTKASSNRLKAFAPE